MVHLHYRAKGSVGDDAIVLLHGWPDSGHSYGRVMPLLPTEYRAIAPDLRGFGDSAKPEAGYTIPELADDVVALLDQVGIERATVVGHSFGSFVARRVAEATPGRVSRLVLIGSGFRAANDVTRGVIDELRTLPDPVPESFARAFQSSTIHLPLPGGFFDELIAESLKLPSRLWSRLLSGLLAFDDVEALGQVRCPTLLLWGDRDVLFSRADQDQLLAALPDARLRIYEDTGHCPNWERPEAVATDIVRFVEASSAEGRQS
jgi:non-heme chloroperoxidase